jgi:four helix bundle protein
MRNFKELKVWQKAHQWVLEIYRVTASFPLEERYGLVSQLRRSAASVPANIAEGRGRKSEREFARYLDIAAGSASETEYHILLAKHT